MAVGLPLKTTYVDGEVFSASDINDTNGTVNLVGQTTNFYAGKNKIINGDFGVWQRGTSFSNPANGSFQADRFSWGTIGTGVTATISQQTFTAGTAPIAGYEGTFYWRYNQTNTGVGNSLNLLVHKIEDVRTFAGQTATLSFWGKADSSRSLTVDLEQDFGSGGSGAVSSTSASLSFTTAWTRFSYTVSLASISGKTIGTGSNLKMRLFLPAGTTSTIDIWGVQLEAGSTATAFQTATGTIQGELAACQRYYYRNTAAGNAFTNLLMGFNAGSTQATFIVPLPVSLRVVPTSLDYGNLQLTNNLGNDYSISAGSISAQSGSVTARINFTSSGLTGGATIFVRADNSTSGHIGLSAEL
jgi:hypothetical protein